MQIYIAPKRHYHNRNTKAFCYKPTANTIGISPWRKNYIELPFLPQFCDKSPERQIEEYSV